MTKKNNINPFLLLLVSVAVGGLVSRFFSSNSNKVAVTTDSTSTPDINHSSNQLHVSSPPNSSTSITDILRAKLQKDYSITDPIR